MSALVRYQFALLLRSQRWLPPLLVYAGLFGVGVRAGQPVLDSLGYAAAVLLPVAAWLVRLCATAEPDAARHCGVAAAGAVRVQLGGVLAGGAAAGVLGLAATAAVLLLGDAHSTDGRVSVPLLPAAGAGVLAVAACVLAGAGVGALCARPVLRARGWGVLATVGGVVLVLAARASPARAAVSGLTSGSGTGTVPASWGALLGAAAFAACAVGLSLLAASRRG
ncbi:ABC transporter [Streptomyces sp. SB3404]|uniref:ABC transporter n=1 Tax=Streptomyces boncukensis TaxID=2711219 RepID=A0A6G4WT14_9ACTN|nr:ABC transporter [Streptomyces boncukensis]